MGGFSAPEDSVTFTFDVENLGNVDAVLSTIVNGSFNCTGTGETAVSDAAMVCNSIKTSLLYDNGDVVAVNDLLNKGKDRSLKLTLKNMATPVNKVSVTGFSLVMLYSQN